ncbi:MAG: S-layer homology domain-containing protein [Acutalibacter sp.]|nr:S-layer homology domain-containing protein [Acutalibacter sp.]
MKKAKRVLSVLLAVFLLASCLPITVWAAEGTAYYSGAPAGGTYTISTVEQLKALAETVNGGEPYENTTFTLTQDIDLNGSESNQWVPIGGGSFEDYDDYDHGPFFSGTFDGDHHKIENLYLHVEVIQENWWEQPFYYLGLFGCVSEGAVVKNLNVTDAAVMITGAEFAVGALGIVAGRIDGEVINCSCTGVVDAGSYGDAGGVVGYNHHGRVINCRHTGAVTGGNVGGVVGWNGNSEMDEDWNLKWENAEVSNCYHTGTVSGAFSGGVVGMNEMGRVTNCYNTGTVTGADIPDDWGCQFDVGGVVGTNSGGIVTKCYNTGKIIFEIHDDDQIDEMLPPGAGGVVGAGMDSTINDCYYLDSENTELPGIGVEYEYGELVEETGNTAEPKTAEEFAEEATFENWDFTSVWGMSTTLKRPVLQAVPEGESDTPETPEDPECGCTDCDSSKCTCTGDCECEGCKPEIPDEPECTCKGCDSTKCTCTGDCSGNTCSCAGCAGKPDDSGNTGGNTGGNPGGTNPPAPSGPSGPSDTEKPDDSGNETPSASKFIDVPVAQYYYNAVDWAVKQGIVAGTSDTTFSPNKNTSRAEIVTLLWRAAGRPEPKTTANPFTDIKASEYYYKAVLWAYENNIASGTSATTFSPNQNCTRGQIVSFLWRAANRPEPVTASNSFTDVKSGEYYYNAVLWAYENKIVAGTTDTTFSPNQSCTRAQAVTFLYRNLAK